ncbi:MAG TPA: hypothetical protein VD741_07625 [Solirubrobacterales bacterium]|nr:hypothetical protein [Solirubrobacterales bacterium]
MEAMAREAWTDERLDDLKDQVVAGFQRVDADIRELRGEVKSVQRIVIYGFITQSGIMVTGFLTLAGLQIF